MAFSIPGLRQTILWLPLLFFLNTTLAPHRTLASGSGCVDCHTHLKKLVRLCWDVEKNRPATKRSAETSGEG